MGKGKGDFFSATGVTATKIITASEGNVWRAGLGNVN